MPGLGAVKTFTLLAGSYTSFINTYKFSVGPNGANLSLYKQNPASGNSTWIERHPVDKTLLFATSAKTPGAAVVSYRIDKDGLVKQLDSSPSQGGSPPHILFLSNGTEVVVPNYSGSNVQSHYLSKDFTTFIGTSPILKFNGSGPDPRQTIPHPHQAVAYGSEVLVPDLGSDKIWRLVKKSGSWVPKAFIQQPIGSGPRHIIPLDGSLYTLHEISSTLTQQKLAPLGKSVSTDLIANISIIPPDAPRNSSFGAAELLVSPPGGSDKKQRYLYASNRNISPSLASLDPRGDTIAIFEVYPKLRLLKHVYTGLQQVRGVQIGGPNGEYLAAGGQGGGGVVIYERLGGDLKELARYNGTGTTQVVSFVWL